MSNEREEYNNAFQNLINNLENEDIDVEHKVNSILNLLSNMQNDLNAAHKQIAELTAGYLESHELQTSDNRRINEIIEHLNNS